MFRNVIWFITNIWTFRKELWDYRPWDPAYIEFFASKLYTVLGKHIRATDNHVGSKRNAQRAFVIAHLLRNYDTAEDAILTKSIREWWDTHTEIEEGNGLTRLVFTEDKNRDRLIDKRHTHADKITEHRTSLLFKYLRKYHKRLWC